MKRLPGFTLIELIITMGLIMALLAMSSLNLISTQRKSAFSAQSIPILVADIRNQQLKAMVGDTEGTNSPVSYGIHFESDSYTLFRGSVYVPGDPANFQVILEPTVRLSSINLPTPQILFQAGSGEIVAFDNVANSLVISDSEEGLSQQIIFNLFGQISSIQ